MALHVHRNIQRRLEARHELEGDVGVQQARHILDANRVRAHVLDPAAKIDPEVDRMHRAYRIGNGALCMFADRQRRFDGGFEVAHVIERIEDAKNVHPVYGAALDKFFDEIVGVMSIAENILAAEQHLLRRIGHRFLEAAYTFPWIFAEITNAGIERRTAPALDGPEPDPVELIRDRQHIFDTHPRRQQALVRVAKDQFGNAKGVFIAHRRIRIPCSPVFAGAAQPPP